MCEGAQRAVDCEPMHIDQLMAPAGGCKRAALGVCGCQSNRLVRLQHAAAYLTVGAGAAEEELLEGTFVVLRGAMSEMHRGLLLM